MGWLECEKRNANAFSRFLLRQPVFNRAISRFLQHTALVGRRRNRHILVSFRVKRYSGGLQFCFVYSTNCTRSICGFDVLYDVAARLMLYTHVYPYASSGVLKSRFVMEWRVVWSETPDLQRKSEWFSVFPSWLYHFMHIIISPNLMLSVRHHAYLRSC